MAVFGVQIVITMMMATVLSRVGPHLSLARWLLTSSYAGLVRYIHPSDEELKQYAPAPLRDKKDKKKGRSGDKSGQAQSTSNGTFNVPRNIEIELEKAPVSLTDILQLRFYSEYQWLVDFSLYTLIVYVLTEVYLTVLPERAAQETGNLSLVWCCLVLMFAYRILLSLTGLYFEGDDGGERSLVLVMGGGYLLFSMMVLVVHEDTLETGLDMAYSSFNESAAAFLDNNAGLDSSGPASKLVLKFFIALWCGLIGALFVFPGLRLARMHWDVLRFTDNARLTVLLHIGFIWPLILTTLWVRPLTRDPMTKHLYRGMTEPLMTKEQYETMRLYLVLTACGYRILLMPRYLQSYLNLAYDKVAELRQEAGKISNVDLQRLVARVFYYLCVVSLQYVTPIIIIVYLTLLYKTLGEGSWTANSSTSDPEECSVTPPPGEVPVGAAEEVDIVGIIDKDEQIRQQFSLAWNSLKNVFTTEVFRGLLGFSTWWVCFCWFSSAAIGMAYQSYFSHV